MYIDDEQGVILHSRPFTDSKIILVVLTRSFGRLSLVHRISKKGPKPKIFTLCSFNWRGKSELKTLERIEELGSPILHHGRSLYCGIYLNEISIRVLPELQAYETVYDQYLETIQKLAQCDENMKLMEILLRRFEFTLLEALGLAINFEVCIDANFIERASDIYYEYDLESGFRRLQLDIDRFYDISRSAVYSGESIVDIREGNWSDSALSAAKTLCRRALAPLLGSKPIKSRELFT